MERRWFEHGEVTSTSDVAFAAIEAGLARHGDVHTARVQTAGRGRRGREWVQAPHEGLALSLVQLPPPPAPSPAGLTMGAGLGVLEACAALGLAGGRLKWPNDLLVGDAKLAGVLVETRGLDPDAPHYVVGVGLNVRQTAFPAELLAERPVTSLALQGVDVRLRQAADVLVQCLDRRLSQVGPEPARLAADYLAALGLAGALVDVEVGGNRLRGRLAGLDLAAGIALDTSEGRRAVPLEHVAALARVPSDD